MILLKASVCVLGIIYFMVPADSQIDIPDLGRTFTFSCIYTEGCFLKSRPIKEYKRIIFFIFFVYVILHMKNQKSKTQTIRTTTIKIRFPAYIIEFINADSSSLTYNKQEVHGLGVLPVHIL